MGAQPRTRTGALALGSWLTDERPEEGTGKVVGLHVGFEVRGPGAEGSSADGSREGLCAPGAGAAGGRSERADLGPPRTSLLGYDLPACDLPPNLGHLPFASQAQVTDAPCSPGLSLSLVTTKVLAFAHWPRDRLCQLSVTVASIPAERARGWNPQGEPMRSGIHVSSCPQWQYPCLGQTSL